MSTFTSSHSQHEHPPAPDKSGAAMIPLDLDRNYYFFTSHNATVYAYPSGSTHYKYFTWDDNEKVASSVDFDHDGKMQAGQDDISDLKTLSPELYMRMHLDTKLITPVNAHQICDRCNGSALWQFVTAQNFYFFGIWNPGLDESLETFFTYKVADDASQSAYTDPYKRKTYWVKINEEGCPVKGKSFKLKKKLPDAFTILRFHPELRLVLQRSEKLIIMGEAHNTQRDMKLQLGISKLVNRHNFIKEFSNINSCLAEFNVNTLHDYRHDQNADKQSIQRYRAQIEELTPLALNLTNATAEFHIRRIIAELEEKIAATEDRCFYQFGGATNREFPALQNIGYNVYFTGGNITVERKVDKQDEGMTIEKIHLSNVFMVDGYEEVIELFFRMNGFAREYERINPRRKVEEQITEQHLANPVDAHANNAENGDIVDDQWKENIKLTGKNPRTYKGAELLAKVDEDFGKALADRPYLADGICTLDDVIKHNHQDAPHTLMTVGSAHLFDKSLPSDYEGSEQNYTAYARQDGLHWPNPHAVATAFSFAGDDSCEHASCFNLIHQYDALGVIREELLLDEYFERHVGEEDKPPMERWEGFENWLENEFKQNYHVVTYPHYVREGRFETIYLIQSLDHGAGKMEITGFLQ